jgi:hypothetical protein
MCSECTSAVGGPCLSAAAAPDGPSASEVDAYVLALITQLSHAVLSDLHQNVWCHWRANVSFDTTAAFNAVCHSLDRLILAGKIQRRGIVHGRTGRELTIYLLANRPAGSDRRPA